ncbi:helix-turn-helix transcriptional regulator [Cellulomonas sp. P5_E12]
MDGQGHLHPGDADVIVGLIASAYEDGPGLSLPAAAFDGLQALFPGSHVQYQVNDVVGQRSVWMEGRDPAGAPVFEGPDDVELELDHYYFDLEWQDPMCGRALRTGDRRSVLLSTDFFPTEQDLRNRAFSREFAPELTSVMAMCLPPHDGYERRIVLGREGGPAFSERDRQVAQLLRPHLEEIWLDAERRRAGVPALTPREHEVLALTASGLTHAQIAARLFISVSTVHKHMEHVREHVGVRTAAAAAAMALPFAPSRYDGHR